MVEPPAKYNVHDSRRLIAVVILIGFLCFGALQAVFAYLGLPDVLADFLTYLSAMSLSILTYYFGVQASNDLVAQQQDTINKQHELLVAAINKNTQTAIKIQDAIKIAEGTPT